MENIKKKINKMITEIFINKLKRIENLFLHLITLNLKKRKI